MTRDEFGTIMAYISAAIGKPLATASLEVYYDLLGDLGADVLQTAAKRVVLQHKWASFPSVAELREAAAETAHGAITELSPAEAWRLAWEVAACKVDPDIEGSTDYHLARLPPLVREAVVTFGVNNLCSRHGPIGVMRAQFLKIYEQLAARNRQVALLPAELKQRIIAIEKGERREMVAELSKALDYIGREP